MNWLKFSTHAAGAIALLLAATPAHPWGPRAESSIVTSAAMLLSKEGLLQIQRIEADLRRGSLTAQAELDRMNPTYASDPISAVEQEMMLLQAMRQPQIDEYYAYRLGALGKVVANLTAPMTQADPSVANLYYADVETNIERTSLQPAKPQEVDPGPYFERRILEANINTDVIAGEYRDGTGFQGVARNLLQQDAGRSVAAVADVWRTIFQGGGANVSQAQREAFVLDAYRYFIAKDNTGQIEAADRRLTEELDLSPDMLIRVGDLFYDAGRRDDAVARYEAALAQSPQRRDVAERIAQYYMDRGKEALESEKLEDALAAYEDALEANPLHPTAEAERLHVAALIEDRNNRLLASQAAIESALGFEQLADQEVLDNHIAEATALLHQANAEYQRVEEAFPLEFQKAQTGMRGIATRLENLRGELFANAQLLSGTGFVLDAPRLAAREGSETDRQAFQTMIRDALAATRESLEAEAAPLLSIE